MAFPEIHNYLTVHWVPVGVSEVGQFGLRFDGPAITELELSDVAADVLTWWTSATTNLQPNYNLAFLRVARIGVDGLYVPGSVPLDYVYNPSPIAGGTGGVQFPLQSATVVSLETGVLSGLAHAGRIYVPPLAGLLSSNQQWATSMVNNMAQATADMLTGINSDISGSLQVYSKGNAAVPGGAKRAITAIHVDCRPDVQRRRAAQLTPILTTDKPVAP